MHSQRELNKDLKIQKCQIFPTILPIIKSKGVLQLYPEICW